MFAVVAMPVLFFALVWVAVTAYRLLYPEKPLPFERDPILVRRQAAATGKDVPVGVREIREDQQHLQTMRSRTTPYHYLDGVSDGFPETWADDLWQRRN
ncbi:MAG: hypothetical protein GVY18_11335 [Bacteroidetes bacterium]|jgi:hypothetical protein|nr:hypothetical protein [Bacteroidota bacterium]